MSCRSNCELKHGAMEHYRTLGFRTDVEFGWFMSFLGLYTVGSAVNAISNMRRPAGGLNHTFREILMRIGPSKVRAWRKAKRAL